MDCVNSCDFNLMDILCNEVIMCQSANVMTLKTF